MDIVTIVNAILLLLITTAYYIACMMYIRRVSKIENEATFERSAGLLILGYSFNYLEVLLNIIAGVVFLNDQVLDQNELYTVVPIIYFTRLYAACMCLRIYRIQLLHNFRSGRLSKDIFLKQTSVPCILFTINIYSILVTTTITIITVVIDFNIKHFIQLNNFCYSFEALFFMGMSIRGFLMLTHPTICIEYFFYSIIWFTGCLNDDQIGVRWLLEIPIRNSVLLMISVYSIYKHFEYIRPPLPLEITVKIIFQVEELYIDFEEFLEELNDKKFLAAFQVYQDAVTASFYKDYEKFTIKQMHLKVFEEDITKLLDESMYGNIKECMEEVLNEALGKYFKSQKFKEFKKLYFVIFN